MKQDRGLGFAAGVSFILFLGSLPVAWGTIKGLPAGFDLTAFFMCISVPASASCTVALLSGLMRSLFDSHKLSLWHILLLPPMHISIMAMIVSLATTSTDSIQRVNEAGSKLYMWHRWSLIGATLVLQVVFLAVILAAQKVWLQRRSR